MSHLLDVVWNDVLKPLAVRSFEDTTQSGKIWKRKTIIFDSTTYSLRFQLN